MSAVVEAREPSAKYLNALQPPLVKHFELMATAPGGVAKLRELILTLAVQGKLVPQDPSDEPASELLKQVRAEKTRLIVEGKIKREKPPSEITEKEQPFRLPNGWAWARIAEIAYPQAGFAFKSSGFNEVRQGLPLIRIRDVGGNDPTTFFAGEYRGEFVVESGDWLISMDGEFRVREWTGPRALLNQRVTRLVFFGRTLFQPFVTAALQFKLSELQGTKAYTTVDHLSGGQIASSVVAIPPLAEQARIVARVEELMRLCDALEAKDQLEATQHAQLVQTLLGALTASTSPDELADNWQRVATHFDSLLDRPEAIDALEQSILQLAVRGLLVPQDPKDEPASELLKRIRAEKDRLIAEGKIKRDKTLEPIEDGEKPFLLGSGWAWIQAQEACDPTSIITYGILKPVWVESGVMTVRVQDMKGGGIRLSALGQCSPERAEKFDKTRLVTGDLLIAKDGATLGKTAFVPPELEGANITQHVLRFPINSKLNRQYIRLVVDSEHGQAWMKSETKGVALPGVNVGDFRRMPIPLPPIGEQARIIERVESLRRLCADLRQRLAARQTTQAHLAEALIDEAA